MKNKKTLTLSIGIPAHNEEGNIENLLKSIFRQKINGFSLEHVYVVCDGCTDSTASLANKMKTNFPSISVINSQEQLGKKARLQQIYKMNESDLIVTFDGDVVLKGEDNLIHISSAMQNPSIGVASFAALPAKPENFISYCIVRLNILWNHIALQVKEGNNVYNTKSCGLALKREVAKQVVFDNSVVSDAQFIYFLAKKLGYKFVFVSNAIIYFMVPTTFKDYFLQSRRTEGNSDAKSLAKIFGYSVFQEYTISTANKAIAVLHYFLKNPLGAITAIIFKLITDHIPSKNYHVVDANFWEPVKSTKKGILI